MAFHKSLPYRIRAELYTQLAQMERAGLPFDRAMDVLELAKPAQSQLTAMRRLIKHHDLVISGERSGLFTTMEAKLIRASVSSGSPARTYSRLADFYTARAQQEATMKSRLLFPVAIFGLALIIQPLPGLVAGSISVSGYLARVVGPLVMIALLVFGLRHFLSLPIPSDGQTVGEKRSSRVLTVPLLGKLIVRRNVHGFFESLGLLLEGGIPMLDALPIALDTITESSIRREFARIGPRMAGGATLSQALADSSYLDDSHSRERILAYINTGEQSGTLPEMLLRHATQEDSEIGNSFEQLATWVPRVAYALVMLWIVIALLSGTGLI